MKRYFQGWKQAIGVLTLVLAVVLIVGAFGHQSIEDTVTFRIILPLNLFYTSIFLIT